MPTATPSAATPNATLDTLARVLASSRPGAAAGVHALPVQWAAFVSPVLASERPPLMAPTMTPTAAVPNPTNTGGLTLRGAGSGGGAGGGALGGGSGGGVRTASSVTRRSVTSWLCPSATVMVTTSLWADSLCASIARSPGSTG